MQINGLTRLRLLEGLVAEHLPSSRAAAYMKCLHDTFYFCVILLIWRGSFSTHLASSLHSGNFRELRLVSLAVRTALLSPNKNLAAYGLISDCF